MPKSLPLRSCAGCRARRPQDTLVRYGRRSDGQVEVSFGPSNGRSAYTCARRGCFERAIKQRGFERAWRRAGKVVYDPASLWSEVVSVSHSVHLRLQSEGPKEPHRLRRYSSLFTELTPHSVCLLGVPGSSSSLRTEFPPKQASASGRRGSAPSAPRSRRVLTSCGDAPTTRPSRGGSEFDQFCGDLGPGTRTGSGAQARDSKSSLVSSSWGSRTSAAVARPTRRAT